MKSWQELKEERFDEDQRKEIEHRVAVERARMTLRALRKELGLTQEELASVMDVSQPELSRIENSENPMLTTLHRYVEALGGSLEVRVVIDDKSVELEDVWRRK